MNMPAIITQYYQSPVGELILGTFQNKLCLCNWRDKKNKAAVERRLFKHFNGSFTSGNNATLETTIKQLSEYFSGQRTQFELPIMTAGTEFQKQVWEALQTIEYGQIIIPCHRIIGSNGKLVGYAGGLAAKQGLIKLEQTLN